jgi:hypothetical protein
LGGDQRVPGLFPHVRLVHRGDPIGHLAGAAQKVALDPAVCSPYDEPAVMPQ